MMRITNGIMMNNCLNNINKNKLQMDKIYTQLHSQKLFQKPSDDPIAAIRSLRLRSTHTEIEQYLKKNVEDAEAWMKITEAAMESLKTTIGGEEQSDGIVSYLNQGISEYQTVSEREKILSTLKSFREAIYQIGNEDNAGRTIFTGYRTDSTLTFMEDVSDRYKITENMTLDSFRDIRKVVDTHTGTGDYAETDIVNEDLHAVMLAYDGLDATLSDGTAMTLSSTTNTALNGHAVTMRSLQANGNTVYTGIGANDIIFVPETGELIFGDEIYRNIDQNDMFSITYEKTGFKAEDLKPENYFYCEKTVTTTTPGGPVSETTVYGRKTEINGVEYKYIENQDIKYNINFNQNIKINVLAKDILPPSLGRDLDIIISAVEAAVDAHKKQDSLEEEIEKAEAAGDDTTAERLKNQLKAAEMETNYAEDNLTKSFKKGLTLYQGHFSEITTQLADIGSRRTRLELNKTRLESQLLTIKELKSVNEDTNLEEAAVEYNNMQDVYDASLKVAVQVVQKSLLEFI